MHVLQVQRLVRLAQAVGNVCIFGKMVFHRLAVVVDQAVEAEVIQVAAALRQAKM